MAEVLEPEPGIAEGAAAQDLETPGWKTPGDADPQVGASRAREGCGTRWAGVGEGRDSPAADLQCSRRVPL